MFHVSLVSLCQLGSGSGDPSDHEESDKSQGEGRAKREKHHFEETHAPAQNTDSRPRQEGKGGEQALSSGTPGGTDHRYKVNIYDNNVT